MQLVVLYSFLAPIVALADIGAQDLKRRFYARPCEILLPVFIGTGVELVVKYCSTRSESSAASRRMPVTMQPCSRFMW
ncbi:hypothetical protein [Caballeronia sp. GAFFF3]|uniref:hypothetical protein n=1 Tax=Caballeronia sp. GAFFF3 TaxID=2921759 RepID=UPI002028C7AE|nr:hypothetical protein [Caballeronia sp. GAFFF3]